MYIVGTYLLIDNNIITLDYDCLFLTIIHLLLSGCRLYRHSCFFFVRQNFGMPAIVQSLAQIG